MMRFMRSTFQVHDISRRASAVALTIMMAGCSADIGRFDSTSFSLDGGNNATASIPTPPERVYAQNDTWNGPVGAGANSGYNPSNSGVQVSALPAPVASEPSYRQPTPSYQQPARSYAPSRAAYAPPRREEPSRHIAEMRPQSSGGRGETIEVRQGDTLYALSRRHHVSVAELMDANGMSEPHLRPGQRLQLPAGHAVAEREPSPRYTRTASLEPASVPPPALAAKYSASYTVQPGDSLYGLSHRYNVPMSELKQANGIIDVRKVRPGTVLKVPGAAGNATFAANNEPPRAEPPARNEAPAATEPAAPEQRPIASTTQPTLLNGSSTPEGRRVASLEEGRSQENRATDASPARAVVPPLQPQPSDEAKSEAPNASPTQAVSVDPPKNEPAPAAAPPAASPTPPVKVAAVQPAQVAVSNGLKLRWPVKGRVIGEFGQRSDGTHNDGINLAVPLGSEVHAAEGGVVAYAGSELKGYGNLILIRHDNGWVTAYAHNDEMMVKRGDKVHRGQVIAKAGKTGTVDQPQLHFELRQGAKPVDPTPYMERS
jgi:murein DD-endopeptidase MepM/ murein hydrolase activator NlpD